MKRHLRENLEVYSDSNGEWVRCSKCSHNLCRYGDDWKQACLSKRSPPTEAGPLFGALEGHLQFEQLFCPSCGLLLNSEMVE